MVFSSLVFLFGFLPPVLLLYFAAPRAWRNALLFAVSLLFYGWGEPVYILLMMASISSAFLFAFLIDRERLRAPKKAKCYLFLSVTVTLGILFFFKYYNFVGGMLHLPLLPRLTLPIGISFYSFQILSYTVDLWRGDAPLQRSYVAFGTYVTLFPQLVAGPIVRYRDIDFQLTDRSERVDAFAAGVRRFCVGLGKKLILGDSLAASHAYFQAMHLQEPTVLGAWMMALLYTLHLYYDFSGYSDMAIGLGRMLGFTFPENFNYPYTARSITDFWRRWHMTLSGWFREYVYIPLGGNRHGRWKQCRNLALVWILTGLWHGANWNFVIWGAYFCVILIFEHLFLRRLLERLPRGIQHLYTLLLVGVSFVIFSTTDLSLLKSSLSALVGVGTAAIGNPQGMYRLLHLLPLLFLAAIGSTPYPRRAYDALCRRVRPIRALSPVLAAVLLLICTAYLVDSTYSPFAYFNF